MKYANEKSIYGISGLFIKMNKTYVIGKIKQVTTVSQIMYFFNLPTARILVYKMSPSNPTKERINVSLTKSAAYSGTSPNQAFNMNSASKKNGMDITNIKKNEYLVPLQTSFLIYPIFPEEYDFITCGFTAVVKLFINVFVTPSTCVAIPLAAFIETPKNRLDMIFIP